MLDSGAAISVVNYDVVRHKTITKVTTCAVGANGRPLDVSGRTTATIQLGDFKVDHPFTVVHNLTVDCLLGADFLQKHDGVLDCCNNMLTVGKEAKIKVPLDLHKQLSSLDTSCTTSVNVCSLLDMEIPARTILDNLIHPVIVIHRAFVKPT